MDLDFRGYKGTVMHPYPATMPLPLAEFLIKKYSKHGELVFDPFMGSGTTLRAAQRLGRDGVGVDLNPLACLIARTYTADVDSLDGDRLEGIRKAMWDLCQSDIDPLQPDERWRPLIDRWFDAEVTKELGQIASCIKQLSYTGIELDILLLSFSRVVRICGLARPGEFKLWRREDTSSVPPAKTIFFQEYMHITSLMLEANSVRNSTNSSIKVYHGDALEFVKGLEEIGGVITSPPYGDAWTTVAYGNFTMLSRVWLGIVDSVYSDSDPTKEDRLTPGGNFRTAESDEFDLANRRSSEFAQVFGTINSENPQRATEFAKFILDITPIYTRIARPLRQGAYIANVVGPRHVAGVFVDTGKIISEIMSNEGLTHVKRMDRQVTGKRLPSRQGSATGSAETINRETIDVLMR